MKISKLLLCSLSLLVLTTAASQSQTKRLAKGNLSRLTIPINTGWQFREFNKFQWHPASVPGCVHTALLKKKLIDDPFFRDNEAKLQWIGKTDWEYQTTFNVAADIIKRDNLELVFQGLD